MTQRHLNLIELGIREMTLTLETKAKIERGEYSVDCSDGVAYLKNKDGETIAAMNEQSYLTRYT